MRYFLDTEFIEDGRTIELISIGLCCEDGREYYAENGEADLSRADDWVKAHVLPHLAGGGIRRWRIANDIREFVGSHAPEFWAYYGDYDWVLFCQLFGKMIELPKGWPMLCMDLRQLALSLGDPKLPSQAGTRHNALTDARWNRDVHRFLTNA